MRFTLSVEDEQRLVEAHVCALYLFGSHATGYASSASDVDFAVVLDDPEILRDIRQKQERYVVLYDILTDVIGRHEIEPIVDIVFLQEDVSLELKGHVVKQGVVLFDRAPNIRANLEALIMERAADFAPLLQEMDRTILERV